MEGLLHELIGGEGDRLGGDTADEVERKASVQSLLDPVRVIHVRQGLAQWSVECKTRNQTLFRMTEDQQRSLPFIVVLSCVWSFYVLSFFLFSFFFFSPKQIPFVELTIKYYILHCKFVLIIYFINAYYDRHDKSMCLLFRFACALVTCQWRAAMLTNKLGAKWPSRQQVCWLNLVNVHFLSIKEKHIIQAQWAVFGLALCELEHVWMVCCWSFTARLLLCSLKFGAFISCKPTTDQLEFSLTLQARTSSSRSDN